MARSAMSSTCATIRGGLLDEAIEVSDVVPDRRARSSRSAAATSAISSDYYAKRAAMSPHGLPIDRADRCGLGLGVARSSPARCRTSIARWSWASAASARDRSRRCSRSTTIGALRLTTARYYTPSGRSVQEGGIEPDIRVPQISRSRLQVAAGVPRSRPAPASGQRGQGRRCDPRRRHQGRPALRLDRRRSSKRRGSTISSSTMRCRRCAGSGRRLQIADGGAEVSAERVTRSGFPTARLIALLLPLRCWPVRSGSQYIGGLYPCEMCQWQRWPHYAAIVLAAAGLCRAGGIGPAPVGRARRARDRRQWRDRRLSRRCRISLVAGVHRMHLDHAWFGRNPRPRCSRDHERAAGPLRRAAMDACSASRLPDSTRSSRSLARPLSSG